MNKKLFAYCGVLAPVIFTVSLIVFSLLTPGYSNATNAVSELGTVGAPYALAWNVLGLTLVGLLGAAFAWGLRQDLLHSSGATAVPVLVALSGLGLTGAGLIPAEAGFAPSLRTTLHFLMVAMNLLPFLLAAFLFAIRLRANEYWRKWMLFSLAMGLLDIATFLLPRSIPGGITQRLGLGAYFVWLFVLGLALLRKQTAAQLTNLPAQPAQRNAVIER